jgi:hypothetical protein
MPSGPALSPCRNGGKAVSQVRIAYRSAGQAFGWTERILVFLSGLVCPVLFVTGVIRWLQKRQAAQKKRHKIEIGINTGEIERELLAEPLENLSLEKILGFLISTDNREPAEAI